MPDNLKESTELLLGGTPIIHTSKTVGIYRQKLKNMYSKHLTNAG
jgi:hypothetical protein